MNYITKAVAAALALCVATPAIAQPIGSAPLRRMAYSNCEYNDIDMDQSYRGPCTSIQMDCTVTYYFPNRQYTVNVSRYPIEGLRLGRHPARETTGNRYIIYSTEVLFGEPAQVLSHEVNGRVTVAGIGSAREICYLATRR